LRGSRFILYQSIFFTGFHFASYAACYLVYIVCRISFSLLLWGPPDPPQYLLAINSYCFQGFILIAITGTSCQYNSYKVCRASFCLQLRRNLQHHLSTLSHCYYSTSRVYSRVFLQGFILLAIVGNLSVPSLSICNSYDLQGFVLLAIVGNSSTISVPCLIGITVPVPYLLYRYCTIMYFWQGFILLAMTVPVQYLLYSRVFFAGFFILLAVCASSKYIIHTICRVSFCLLLWGPVCASSQYHFYTVCRVSFSSYCGDLSVPPLRI
jgi:hypothetical protein